MSAIGSAPRGRVSLVREDLTQIIVCAAWFLSGRQPHPARVASAGSNCSDEGGDETVEAYDPESHSVTPRACGP